MAFTVRSTSTLNQQQDHHRANHHRMAKLALCLTVGAGVLVYLALSLHVSANPLLLPLDDSYIHFNYARQLAHGHPMVYSPGDPATSGGTSLLYPVLLALGYGLGFGGWSLAYWALGLGVLSFLGSAWLVYVIGRDSPLIPVEVDTHGIALLLAVAYAATGPFVWAALSGMETALFLFAVLLTLRALQARRFGWMVGAGLLAVGLRPEGVIVAGGAALAWAAMDSSPKTRSKRFRQAAWLALPVAAALIQPAINLAVTGDLSSSGMQAKSHLANGSISLASRLDTIVDFWGRIWLELLAGSSPDQGHYMSQLAVLMALLAFAWALVTAWQRRQIGGWRVTAQRVALPLVILAWMIGLTLAIALLDTAFWQFKRYQLPVMALFFPAAAWGSALFGERMAVRTGTRWVRWIIPVIICISAALSLVAFARYYRDNVRVVRDQQVSMAQWVRDNLPEDARIGVHDVGLMRYFGDRALYDVVGLTTPGPAASWRQGPGAIYEHMASSDYRPDYFAIYPDVQGLSYLVEAGVFGQVLAEFPVELPKNTVASAAAYQAVYRADWSDTRPEEVAAQASTLDALAQVEGLHLVDQVDVANLDSEAAHDFRWWQDDQPEGFVTEVYRHSTYACGLSTGAECRATDGGRVLTGGEEFTIRSVPGEDVLLVTRVHGRSSVPLIISWGEQPDTITRTQPAMPGGWVEIVTLLPGESITSDTTRIRIEVDPANMHDVGAYLPFYHWVYQGQYVPDEAAEPETGALFGEAGSIHLIRATIITKPGRVMVDLTWSRAGVLPPGDGVLFVHLYNGDNITTEPVAQIVERPARGVLPPENWLPGTFEDSHSFDLPDGLPAGRYKVAIGFFDAIDGHRYDVTSDAWTVDDRRLFIGEITIEESGP